MRFIALILVIFLVSLILVLVFDTQQETIMFFGAHMTTHELVESQYLNGSRSHTNSSATPVSAATSIASVPPNLRTPPPPPNATTRRSELYGTRDEGLQPLSALLSLDCMPRQAPRQLTPLPAGGSCPDFVVMVTVSSGYYDFFLNWLHYGRRHLDVRACLVAVAEDSAAVTLLRQELPRSSVVQGIGEDVKEGMEDGNGPTIQANRSIAFEYGGKAFGALVRQRPRRIASLLRKGIAVLYSDLDLIWVHNPLPMLLRHLRARHPGSPHASSLNATNASASKWSVDVLVMDDDPENVGSACSPRAQAVHQLYLCTCFLFVAPTAGAVALIQQWDLRIKVRQQECAVSASMPCAVV